MTSDRGDVGREILPIPDRPHVGLVTYDAKDPDTSFPAIEPLRPPAGAPNVLIVLLDDVGGTVSLYVDGDKAGEGRVEATQPMVFSADETTDVGADSATPVSDDYGPRDSHFTGRVRWIQIDIDDAAEDLDHLIGPEERIRVAMARQ